MGLTPMRKPTNAGISQPTPSEASGNRIICSVRPPSEMPASFHPSKMEKHSAKAMLKA